MKKQFLATVLAVGILAGSGISLTASAHDYRGYNGSRYSDRYDRNRGFLADRPYVKKAVLVGGTGAAVGGLLARDGSRVDGAIKGALIGAGAGLGYEYLKRQGTFSGRW